MLSRWVLLRHRGLFTIAATLKVTLGAPPRAGLLAGAGSRAGEPDARDLASNKVTKRCQGLEVGA